MKKYSLFILILSILFSCKKEKTVEYLTINSDKYQKYFTKIWVLKTRFINEKEATFNGITEYVIEFNEFGEFEERYKNANINISKRGKWFHIEGNSNLISMESDTTKTYGNVFIEKKNKKEMKLKYKDNYNNNFEYYFYTKK